jgi:neutral trehalase
MVETAEGATLNLVYLAELFGFVPNGGRTYYSRPGRSQPPLLSSMVRDVHAVTGNTTFLARSYRALAREYNSWFMAAGEYGHSVAVMEEAAPLAAASNATGAPPPPPPKVHLLARYVTDQHLPRPESYYEDVHTAATAGFAKGDWQAQVLFSEIAAAAESGHDFTSRFFGDGASIATSDTSHVLPVELNAMLYRVEVDMARFAGMLGKQAAECAAAAAAAAAEAEAEAEVGGGGGGAAAADGGGGAGVDGCDALRELHGGGVMVGHGAPASAAFAAIAGNFAADAARYADAAEDRAEAMERLLWDGDRGTWTDLRVRPEALPHAEPPGAPQPTAVPGRGGQRVGRTVAARYKPRTDLQLGRNVHRVTTTSLAAWTPLWSGGYCFRCSREQAAARVRTAARALNTSGLVHEGGVAATLARTKEQWDWPNGVRGV